MTIPYLIQGGIVYDGGGEQPIRADVRIRGEKIVEISPQLSVDGDAVINATGLILCPGLIDLHAHVYGGMGLFSVDPEEAGLSTGVTTLLDTGSAGCLNYGTFVRYVMPQAREEIYALLNISQYGVQGSPSVEPFIGDLYEIRHLHAPAAIACIREYPDRIIGTKVRLTAYLANDRIENEYAGFHGALEAAEATGRFCMVHHVQSAIPVSEVLQKLRGGDVFTHMYHPRQNSGFAAHDGAPLDAMHQARERGVIFDVGHGMGSFAWRVAEPACQQHSFWPDTISSDIHRFNINGPVFDLVTTMSKFLFLGMPLETVIRACTLNPARIMSMDDRLGRLRPGGQADVTLLRLTDGNYELFDVEGQKRVARHRLVNVGVFKNGVWYGEGEGVTT